MSFPPPSQNCPTVTDSQFLVNNFGKLPDTVTDFYYFEVIREALANTLYSASFSAWRPKTTPHISRIFCDNWCAAEHKWPDLLQRCPRPRTPTRAPGGAWGSARPSKAPSQAPHLGPALPQGALFRVQGFSTSVAGQAARKQNTVKIQ